MRKLSDEAVEVIRQLYELEQSRAWFGSAKREEAIRSLLDSLANAGEPAALPDIARFLVASSDPVRRSARWAVARLLSNVSPYDLMHFDDYSIRSYCWRIAEAWDKIEPSDVVLIAGDTDDANYVPVLGNLRPAITS